MCKHCITRVFSSSSLHLCIPNHPKGVFSTLFWTPWFFGHTLDSTMNYVRSSVNMFTRRHEVVCCGLRWLVVFFSAAVVVGAADSVFLVESGEKSVGVVADTADVINNDKDNEDFKSPKWSQHNSLLFGVFEEVLRRPQTTQCARDVGKIADGIRARKTWALKSMELLTLMPLCWFKLCILNLQLWTRVHMCPALLCTATTSGSIRPVCAICPMPPYRFRCPCTCHSECTPICWRAPRQFAWKRAWSTQTIATVCRWIYNFKYKWVQCKYGRKPEQYESTLSFLIPEISQLFTLASACRPHALTDKYGSIRNRFWIDVSSSFRRLSTSTWLWFRPRQWIRMRIDCSVQRHFIYCCEFPSIFIMLSRFQKFVVHFPIWLQICRRIQFHQCNRTNSDCDICEKPSMRNFNDNRTAAANRERVLAIGTMLSHRWQFLGSVQTFAHKESAKCRGGNADDALQLGGVVSRELSFGVYFVKCGAIARENGMD